ncbi:PKD domain-containing protein [Prolixibacteraceae bacterium JC049]|nr:PKD domain-containing protein [Prolixibacteraceae bacterium JC049]
MLVKTIKTYLICLLVVVSSCSEETNSDTVVTADFSFNKKIQDNKLVVEFTNLSKNATSYTWSFPGGNPTVSNEKNPTVTYSENKTFEVTLNASNLNSSAFDGKSEEIVVAELEETDTSEGDYQLAFASDNFSKVVVSKDKTSKNNDVTIQIEKNGKLEHSKEFLFTLKKGQFKEIIKGSNSIKLTNATFPFGMVVDYKGGFFELYIEKQGNWTVKAIAK